MATMSATMKQFTKGLKTSLEPMQVSLANIEKCSCLVSSRENEVEAKRLEKEKLDTEKEQTAALKKIAGNSAKETKEKDKEKDKGFLAKHWGKILIGGIVAAALLPSFKTLDTIGKTVREIEKIVKNIIQWVTTGSFGGTEMLEGAAKVTRLAATTKAKPGKINFKQIKQTRLIKPTPQKKIILPKITKSQAPIIPETPERRVVRPVDRRLRVIKGGALPKPAEMPKEPQRKVIKPVVSGKKHLRVVKPLPTPPKSSLPFRKLMSKIARIRTAAAIASAVATPYAGAVVMVLATALEVWAETEHGQETLAEFGVTRDEVIDHIITKGKLAKSFTVNQSKADEKEFLEKLKKRMSADQLQRLKLDTRTKDQFETPKKSGRIPAPSPNTGKREYKRGPGGGWVRKSSFGGSSGFSIKNASLGGSSGSSGGRNPFSNIWKRGSSRIDWATIHGQEGNRLRAYIPTKNGNIIGKSGVTIASGFDLGQWKLEDFNWLKDRRTGDPKLYDKIKPFIGLKGNMAKYKLISTGGFNITADQAALLDEFAKKTFTGQMKDIYGPSWDSFTTEQKTAATSVAFQYGAAGTPNFTRMMKNRNFRGAAAELRDSSKWESFFPERANQNANMIVRSLRPNVNPGDISRGLDNLHSQAGQTTPWPEPAVNVFNGGDDNSRSTPVSFPGGNSAQDRTWNNLTGQFTSNGWGI